MVEADKPDHEAIITAVKESLLRDYFLISKVKATAVMTGFMTFVSLTGWLGYSRAMERISDGLEATALEKMEREAQGYVDIARENSKLAKAEAKKAKDEAKQIATLLEDSKDGDLAVKSLTVDGASWTSTQVRLQSLEFKTERMGFNESWTFFDMGDRHRLALQQNGHVVLYYWPDGGRPKGGADPKGRKEIWATPNRESSD